MNFSLKLIVLKNKIPFESASSSINITFKRYSNTFIKYKDKDTVYVYSEIGNRDKLWAYDKLDSYITYRAIRLCDIMNNL